MQQSEPPERATPPLPPVMNRLASLSWRILLIAALVLVVVFIAVRLRLLIVPFIVGVMIATVLSPPVDKLQSLGLPRALATVIVLLMTVLLLGGVISVIIPQVIAEAEDLQENLTEGVDEIKIWLSAGPLGIPQETVDQYWDDVVAQFEASIPEIASGVLSRASLGLEILVGLVLIFPIVFFLVKDGRKIRDWCLGSLGAGTRDTAMIVGARAWHALGTYVKGLAILGLIDATLIALGLLIIGVPLVLPIAVLTFVMAFIPIVGATLSGVIAILVALVSGGAVDAMLTAGLVVAVQQLEGNVIAPFVLGRSVHLHPLVILMAITGGGVLGGIVGAFLSVPFAAMIAGVLEEVRLRAAASRPPEDAIEGETTGTGAAAEQQPAEP